MKRKYIKAILLLTIVMVGMTGCKSKEEQSDSKEVVQEETETKEETEKEPEVIPVNENLLSGVPDLTEGAIGKRPVAIMVNNINDAMPQYGIAEADIIFELPVEENLTRFMAMYGDYTQVPDVCAIRSCRYNFPTLSEGFDAFYTYWGMSESTQPYFDSLQVDYFDGLVGTGNLFARDESRIAEGYSLEHTGYFKGTEMVNYIESVGMRTDIEEDNAAPAFVFNGLEEQIMADGEACTGLNIEFGAATATFDYDEERKLYTKQLNGNNQIDGKTNEQLAFTNVFVLETQIGLLENNIHKEIDMVEGKGYYISNGGKQEIVWKKEGGEANSHLEFFDLEGEELSINRGKSYIAFNVPDQTQFN